MTRGHRNRLESRHAGPDVGSIEVITNGRCIALVVSLSIFSSVVACHATERSDVISLSTGNFDVPPGDSFTCFYTDRMTDRELVVTSAQGWQLPGGHHITVHYTLTPKEPSHSPCDMAKLPDWRWVTGSAGHDVTHTSHFELPSGLAVKIPVGAQLLIQSHYINTTGSTFIAHDSVTLHLADPKTVQAYANRFLVFDDTLKVSPHANARTVTTCTVPREINIVLLNGHLHEFGKRYTLEKIDASGRTLETLWTAEWVPSYTWLPPVAHYSMEHPLTLQMGTRLRQTCEWENPTDQPLQYPREMCAAVAAYFPDQGELMCKND